MQKKNITFSAPKISFIGQMNIAYYELRNMHYDSILTGVGAQNNSACIDTCIVDRLTKYDSTHLPIFVGTTRMECTRSIIPRCVETFL